MADNPKPRTIKPLDPDVVTFGGVIASDLLALTASDPAPEPLPEGVIDCAWRTAEEG